MSAVSLGARTGRSPPASAGAEAIKQGKVAAGPRSEERLLSLDAFRGFTMFWIIGGGSLVVGLRALDQNVVLDTIVHHLAHSQWQGIRYYDLIWPSFMLMVGAAIPLARAKRAQTATPWQMHAQAVRRAAILFLLGSLRQSISASAPAWIELSSALQPIAVAYLVAHFLAFTAPRTQALVAGSIWLVYGLLLAFVPALGIPAGTYVQGENLVTAVDLAVLGQAHRGGWGTLLSTFPTISTTIVGLLVGELLISSASQRRKMGILTVVGVSGVLLGTVLDLWIPVIMKIWTTSYGILATGWACLMFLFFYWLVDVCGFRRLAFPLAVIGMNALAIYISKSLVPLPKIVGIFTGAVSEQLGSFTPLIQAIGVLAVEWLVLYWMYQRRIFLRA